jgi:protein-S-isoprenylcysteine O-methyltransferase Ste14
MSADETSTGPGPKVRIHPPLLMFGALLAGYLLRLFFGGRLPLPRAFAEGAGGLLLILGIALVMAAVNQFNTEGERLLPSTPSAKLLSGGVYRFSRNPIYLGMMLFGVGFGVATANLWIILTTALAGAILQFFVIRPEEAYLAERFGADYAAYRARVRRWI